jgi:hypothetical protein
MPKSEHKSLLNKLRSLILLGWKYRRPSAVPHVGAIQELHSSARDLLLRIGPAVRELRQEIEHLHLGQTANRIDWREVLRPRNIRRFTSLLIAAHRILQREPILSSITEIVPMVRTPAKEYPVTRKRLSATRSGGRRYGPAANLQRHEVINTVVQSYGGDFRDDLSRKKMTKALDRTRVALPKTWSNWKPTPSTWLEANEYHPERVVDVLRYAVENVHNRLP